LSAAHLSPIPYLQAEAAALGDRELSPRARPALSATLLQELEYGADLFRRAEKAVTVELSLLQGLDVGIDWKAAQEACNVLQRTAVAMHIRTVQHHELEAA
jgi:hypothetical protein